MATLVLTVIGDDRAGLVNALADVVSSHGGNWSRSQLAELSGKFAGIVEIEVDDARSSELAEALAPLQGLLDVAVHTGSPAPSAPREAIGFELVGNDRPGLVQEVTGVLRDHQVSIDRFESAIVDAPMAGGRLFRATVTAHVDDAAHAEAAVAALQKLAGELMVDLDLR
ncbi:glycine cleavage system protein R [Aestuariimicrobium sp. T2.26MG-19.2B]|uniref:glycine cleavage system protein R n=1 Tax=Aestuariimicrobium sp. T2.26MG-19.2B TaxID=3040679 RepID=UPI002477A32C|nr:ACT domain-containing protein [Aestuariimicrobium sp. T2.26MG-19.2B]CAI9403463.1 Glycine cleavage system transcriptional repressor [Aestuariimicrobium sp. T2.26MG-19.2B]